MSELPWNTFVGKGNCVYHWVTMRNMENDKNHTVEHIRWVSYTEKHICWKRDLGISMSSYNEKHWKTNSLETGCVYQWVTMRNMKNDKNHTIEHIGWVSYTEKHIRWKLDLGISMSYNEKHWKTNSLETGFVYINELQWETWKMIKTTL